MTKTRYRASYTFDGIRHWVDGKTQAEAEVNALLAKRESEAGKKHITRNMPCRDWCGEYLRVYREPVVAVNTYKEDVTLWRVHIEPAIGAMLLKDIKALHCQAVLNAAAEKGRKEKQIKKIRIFMRGLFRAAIENGLLIENPAGNTKIPICESDGTHRAITDTERGYLLTICKEHPHPLGVWIGLMLYCGLRPGETARVRGGHVDIAAERLYIDGTKTKAAKRYAPIPSAFLSILAPYAKGNFDYLLKNGAGQPLTKTNMRRMWERVRKEIHILMGGSTDYGGLRRVVPPYLVAADLVPYCLRHTYCTDLQNAGVPINIAKELMGHTTLEMTARIYTHFTDTAFESARDLINRANGI